MNWIELLHPGVPWLEKILRPLVVYAFLLVAFRLAGKRELGQTTPFDLIVLLTISNVLQNAMIGGDDSLAGGVLGAATLFAANGVVARLVVRVPQLGKWIEGKPTPLIEKGRILADNLRRELMTQDDLDHAMRKHDLDPKRDLPSIALALLEGDGSVTIVRNQPRSADRS